ncbi:MAG: hypothetical protein ACLP8A_13235 [Methylovirgula sp.]
MSEDIKALEAKVDELRGMVAALTFFILELPDAKLVEMPKMKAAIGADKVLTEAQKKIATDTCRDLKHAAAERGGGDH